MWIVKIALRRPYTFVVAALLIALSTPWVIRSMPSDVFPQIDIPVVAVLWQYNGLSARDMADRITGPSERGLTQSVTDIEHTESQTLAGLSVIKVFFQPGTDIRTALTQVLSNTTTVQRMLPQGIQPPQVYQYSATDLPILQLGLSSDTIPDTQLSDLANNEIRARLVTLPGVSLNNPYGSANRQVSVDLDGAALLGRGLAPVDVVNAIGEQNLVLPTGAIKLGANDYPVALNGAVASIALMGDIPIRTINGSTTYVRDVAQLRDGASTRTTLVAQNGERGVLLSILKNSTAGTVDVVRRVRETLPKIQEQIPEDIRLEPMFDQSLFVSAAIRNVVHEALIAALLTAAMLLLFLGNWRSTCIVAISIPLSIFTSLILLHAIGQTLNLMTLGGLALAVGILVDDATVEIENIERQMASGKPTQQAILDGAQEIALPALVSTLCICIVFLPLFFLTGIARSLFVPLAEAVIFAMLASYVLSRTLVPTLVMYMMARGHAQRPAGAARRVFDAFERAFEALRKSYTSLLAAALGHRRATVLAFVAVFLVSAALYPLLGRDFFPSVDSGQLRLHVRAPAGTRLEEMPPLIQSIDEAIRETIGSHDLENVLDIIGGPYSPRNTVFGNAGTVDAADSEIMISLKADHRMSADEHADRLREVLPNRFPGIEFFFQPADQVSQALNFGAPAPIDIQISGSRGSDNRDVAIALTNELRTIPGLVDVHLFQRSNRPSLNLEMDRSRLQQLGLTARDVAQNLLIYLSGSGQTSPSYWLNPANGNTYNIGVQTRDDRLDSLDALLRTPVSGSATGAPQLLGNVVNVNRSTQPSVVSRYDGAPMLNIHANVSGRDWGSVGREIEARVEQYRPKLARGGEIEIRGLYRTMRSSYRGLAIGLVIAVGLVYFLIVVNFQSWLDPLAVVAGLPIALAGITWLLFLSGTPLSVPALTGAIMTVGVATANSILVISFARDRLRDGVPAIAAALAAGGTRLRPVLMTALAMIAGMLPMALGAGEGGEQNAPLGRAVIGGLVFATIATLFWVPVVFAIIHRTARTRHD